jgi:large subunit ribosomal protein L1
MGKVRKVVLGDEQEEQEQKRKADARRETKKSKKIKDEDSTETSAPDAAAESGDGKKDKKGKKDGAEKVARSRGKKLLAARALVDRNTVYSLGEAVALVKKTSFSKFDGSVELHVNINVSANSGKKDLRGEVSLPHGTGKKVNVVVADEALIEKIAAGTIDFDILVAHPSMMPKLAKVARILGPKGLMPNPKTGTVTTDVEKRVKELSSGQVTYKTEPDNPIVHMIVGKVSFPESQIMENVEAVVASIGKGKIAKMNLAASMGPGVKFSV